MRVPGHWQLEDAFGLYEGLVLYRCRFAWRPPVRNEMISLRFGGVYYSARVWLNGTYLGDHQGYFGAFEFDVTDILAKHAENELLVEINSPEELAENERETIGGVWARWDGLDPHINPGGIFREVDLVSSRDVRITSLGATADSSGYGQAHIELRASRCMLTTLTGLVRPLGFDAPDAELERGVRLEKGSNRFAVDFFLPRVRPWWTWDRGEQPLYELTLGCGGIEDAVRFGARSVELRDWRVYLNGERLFLRGINYLPTDAYPARASKQRLRADASLVRDAGMNAVRVHAHVAEKAFYEACDELGLLVFQDFPLQWTHRRSVLGSAGAQAREMVRDLRSYPCVGIYLAHDEPFYVVPPEKWSLPNLLRTAAEVLSPRWALWQRRVLDRAVVRAIQREDKSRPVIDAAGHPLTTNHLYFGWYYGSFRNLELAVQIFPVLSRLPTEYGAQALPDLESLQEIWLPGQAPVWETLSLNYRLQAQRMLRYVPWEGDRTDFVRKTQRYQAEVLKHATELFRRRKYHPTGGTFAFMLKTLERLVASTGGRALVAPHFYGAGVLGSYKERNPRAFAAVVLTDYVPNAIGVPPNLDLYVVADEAAADLIMKLGVPEEKIHPTGIPIDPAFEYPADSGGIREDLLKLEDDDLPIVLVMGGGLGGGDLERAVSLLLEATAAMHLVVLCGSNERSRERLERKATRGGYSATFLAFTDRVRDLMAAATVLVTKPGGMSCMEALASGLPQVLYHPIPGQEEDNAAAMVRYGAGVVVKKTDEILGETLKILTSPDHRSQMVRSARSAHRPDSARAAAELILAGLS